MDTPKSLMAIEEELEVVSCGSALHRPTSTGPFKQAPRVAWRVRFVATFLYRVPR